MQINHMHLLDYCLKNLTLDPNLVGKRIKVDLTTGKHNFEGSVRLIWAIIVYYVNHAAL